VTGVSEDSQRICNLKYDGDLLSSPFGERVRVRGISPSLTRALSGKNIDEG
jgi:hypothetical protein